MISSNQMVFLTYIPRSGSTLLARMLNEYEQLAVSKSGKFPDGITTPELEEEADLTVATNKLFDDPHFADWGLSAEEVQLALAPLNRPYRFQALLPAVLQAYFSKQSKAYKKVIYKNNRYIHHVVAIRNLFPGSRFIYMLRDPRGIFNSTKHHIDIRTQKPMNGNTALAAHIFRMTCKSILQFKDESWFHILRYEDLAAFPEREMKRLIDFLDIDDLRTDSDSYRYTISESQSALHRNVSLRPDPGIASKWKEELPEEQAWAIQSDTADMLAQFGYETINYQAIPTSWRLKKLQAEAGITIMRLKGMLKSLAAELQS